MHSKMSRGLTTSGVAEQESIHPGEVQIASRGTGSFTVREKQPRISRMQGIRSVCMRESVAETADFTVSYFFNVRMYFTTSLIWSPVSLPS